MKLLISLLFALISMNASAFKNNGDSVLSDLKNYQINTPTMVSAGLPSRAHFEALKVNGVQNVVDLIPGDRSDEAKLMKTLDLRYYNIAVEWQNPTVENYADYVIAMRESERNGGVTLTHCKLNWRGAVFTYLYRVIQLKESEKIAKKDLLETWPPNERWQAFIVEVKAKYGEKDINS
jgi:protein tyrosine phosphatase (PTP) superfamily phosphohydrolase (DUF442 family)